MADPTPAITLPEWVAWLGGVIGAAIAAFVARSGMKAGSQDRNDAAKVGMIAAVQPSATRLTEDVMVQTLGSLKFSIDRLVDLLERQEKERQEDERDELRDLRRWKDELERGGRR